MTFEQNNKSKYYKGRFLEKMEDRDYNELYKPYNISRKEFDQRLSFSFWW